MIKWIYILLIFLIGCKPNKQTKIYDYENIKYFNDFDYYNVKGVVLLDPDKLRYPFVRVENLDTILKLQFHFSKKEIKYDFLHKRTEYWISSVDSIKEYYMQYFISYYYKNNKYRVEYHMEKNVKYLDQYIIAIKKHDNSFEKEIYFFHDDKILENLPWKTNITDCMRREIHSESVSNDTIYAESIYFSHGKKSEEIHCYECGNFPINFFYFFHYNFKKIICKE